MGSDAEQANILTGKQVEPGRGTVEGLCLIIEHRVEREIFRQGQVGIIPRFGERDRLSLDGHPQIVEVGIADQKGHARQVSQGVWKGERYLPASRNIGMKWKLLLANVKVESESTHTSGISFCKKVSTTVVAGTAWQSS